MKIIHIASVVAAAALLLTGCGGAGGESRVLSSAEGIASADGISSADEMSSADGISSADGASSADGFSSADGISSAQETSSAALSSVTAPATDPAVKTTVSQSQGSARPTSTAAQAHERLEVLILGDSNTEYGYITRPLEELVTARCGRGGSGYITFSRKSAQPLPEGVSLSVGQGWESEDITELDWFGREQVDAPFGLCLSGSGGAGDISLKFRDGGITVYYLAKPGGGSFSVLLDGKQIDTIDTSYPTASGL